MTIPVLNILLLFSLTIFLGYIGSLIFRKTNIPDVIWLMLFGLIVSYSGFLDRNIFLTSSELLGALAILIILFDAGINMNFYQLVRDFIRSIFLSSMSLLVSIVVVGFFFFVIGMDFRLGMILGAILGGTSSPIVLSIVNKLNIRSQTKTILGLESIFTDALCIVLTITIVQMMISSVPLSSAANSIIGAFSIGAVSGVFFGSIWVFILDKLKGNPFDYMLTLAMLFICFVATESVSGSGAIASLVFGLMLGNANIFSKIFKIGKRFFIDASMKSFHKEISFFIRSFFFVYIGLIVVIKFELLLYGIAISALLILTRLIISKIGSYGMNITKIEKRLIYVMTPRGLAAVVLAPLPAAYGIANATIFPDIVFIVVTVTILYSTVMVKLIEDKKVKC